MTGHASSNRVHCALCGRFHDAPACKFGEPPADAIPNREAKRLAFLWGITEDEAQRRIDADAIPNRVASEAGRVDGSVKSDPDHRAGRLAIREDAGPAGHATRNRVPHVIEIELHPDVTENEAERISYEVAETLRNNPAVHWVQVSEWKEADD